MSDVLITGASGLIGSGIADHLALRGHRVNRIDIDAFDLTSIDDVARMFNAGYQECDVLINCFAFNDHVAPGVTRGTILDLDVTAFDACMNTNVTALFCVCQEYARRRLGRGGCIVNFGASTGIVTPRTDMYGGMHKNIAYSTSKAAVIHMTKILATHLVVLDPKFRVNCISPGGIEADQSDDFKQLYGSHAPAARMGRVSDLFPAIEMLIDERNAYMIGENIVVDGGWTIQ